MKKTILLAVVTFFTIVQTTHAQLASVGYYEDLEKKTSKTANIDTIAWVYDGLFTLGLNQGILHNWAAGGEIASLTANSQFIGSLIRYHNRHVWTNNLDAAYSLYYAQSQSFKPQKTDDRIDLTSKYGYRLKDTSNFYITGLFNAKTQFTKGYNYNIQNWDTMPISNFLSPLYLTFAPGIEYRRGSELTLFISPATARLIFVDRYYTLQSEAGAFGVPYGKTSQFELGAYFTGRYRKDFTKNISYRARLDLYSNYLAKDEYLNGELVKKDNPANIDILIDNFISFKIFKYFSVNFGIVAMYDNDVPYNKALLNANGTNDPFKGLGWWQVKQVLNFGFNYKF